VAPIGLSFLEMMQGFFRIRAVRGLPPPHLLTPVPSVNHSCPLRLHCHFFSFRALSFLYWFGCAYRVRRFFLILVSGSEAD